MVTTIAKISPSTCTHSWHFVELETENEHYVKKVDNHEEAAIRTRATRYTRFICDLCGQIKQVEVQ